MEARSLIDALSVAERLKDATRHCYTSGGRHESVAEHSWRLALMAYWVSDEFPELDTAKVIKMCRLKRAIPTKSMKSSCSCNGRPRCRSRSARK